MPLFQISFRISAVELEWLEELLCELEDTRWNLYLDQDSQEGQATGIFEDEREAREAWSWQGPLFEEIMGTCNPEFTSLPDRDWKDSYKDHFRAWNFEGLHWVPVWEKESFSLPAGDAVVWLDPGMAFGTGNHETTRLCIEALIDFLGQCRTHGRGPEALSCCDAGCGSGILALSAKVLGIGEVLGFDNDPDAVRISYENTALNGLGGRIDFHVAGLETGFQDRGFDLILANILAPVLRRYARKLLLAVNPGGRLILSGILTSEAEEVRHCFGDEMKAIGLTGAIGMESLGEWSGVMIDF